MVFFNYIATFCSWLARFANRPKKLQLDKLYPTDLLETGYDIMFFWAFRMVAMCHALSGKIPYREILFHGLITDSEGRKMSKSLGNVIDPMDLIHGVKLDELNDRILKSNLSEKEKKASIRNQKKSYPNGIEAVGSDATRLGLLVQDFKSLIILYNKLIISIVMQFNYLKATLLA